MRGRTARFRRFEFMAKIAAFVAKHQLPAMQGANAIKTAHADNKGCGFAPAMPLTVSLFRLETAK
jgi:hypothetical protein